jgi:hypothetical protein
MSQTARHRPQAHHSTGPQQPQHTQHQGPHCSVNLAAAAGKPQPAPRPTHVVGTLAQAHEEPQRPHQHGQRGGQQAPRLGSPPGQRHAAQHAQRHGPVPGQGPGRLVVVQAAPYHPRVPPQKAPHPRRRPGPIEPQAQAHQQGLHAHKAGKHARLMPHPHRPGLHPAPLQVLQGGLVAPRCAGQTLGQSFGCRHRCRLRNHPQQGLVCARRHGRSRADRQGPGPVIGLGRVTGGTCQGHRLTDGQIVQPDDPHLLRAAGFVHLRIICNWHDRQAPRPA